MRAIDEVRWLERVSALCATSAVAYKAAFMLTLSTREGREHLDRCTARYALLECLLSELHTALGAARLRRLIDSLDADPSRYTDRMDALSAASAIDRDLRHALAGRPAGAVSVRTPDAAPAIPLTVAGASAA